MGAIYDETTLLIIRSIWLFPRNRFFSFKPTNLKDGANAGIRNYRVCNENEHTPRSKRSKLETWGEFEVFFDKNFDLCKVIVEVKKVFEIFDEDHDGKITTKELGGTVVPE